LDRFLNEPAAIPGAEVPVVAALDQVGDTHHAGKSILGPVTQVFCHLKSPSIILSGEGPLLIIVIWDRQPVRSKEKARESLRALHFLWLRG